MAQLECANCILLPIHLHGKLASSIAGGAQAGVILQRTG